MSIFLLASRNCLVDPVHPNHAHMPPYTLGSVPCAFALPNSTSSGLFMTFPCATLAYPEILSVNDGSALLAPGEVSAAVRLVTCEHSPACPSSTIPPPAGLMSGATRERIGDSGVCEFMAVSVKSAWRSKAQVHVNNVERERTAILGSWLRDVRAVIARGSHVAPNDRQSRDDSPQTHNPIMRCLCVLGGLSPL